MTPERTRLLAELEALRRADELAPGTASIPYAIAEREAKLAKLDAEPDRELMADAVQAFRYASGCEAMTFDEVYDGLIAAAPLMPRDAGMTDAELREIVCDCWTDSAGWTADRVVARFKAHLTGEGK
jgi:hypothetical protein